MRHSLAKQTFQPKNIYHMGILSNILGNAGAIDPENLQNDFSDLFTENENVEVGFNIFRDKFIFTNKRLIMVNVQGMTGKKTEYLSIPYSKITKYSIETNGSFDLDAELKIWVGSDPSPIQKKFNKKVNIYDLQKVLSKHTLS